MYRQVLANEATASRRRVTFHLVDATDGITAETGEAAGQPQVSDDGAAWTNTGIGTLSSVGSGEYTADLTQTIVATAGHFIRTRYKSAATAEARGTTVQVVAFDPHSTSMGLLLAAANLSADTITDTKIATGAITAAKFAANAITSTVIAADAIGASQIAADAIGSSELAASAVTEIRSQASGTSDSGSTTTMVDAARTEADTDYWKGDLILFTSGTIAGQCRLITGFNAATDTITFAPATTQAVGTQTYEILPAGAVDVRLWNGTVPNNLVAGRVDADAGAISTDSVAADRLETMLDGTGGNTLTLGQLRINSSSAAGAVDIDNSGGPGIAVGVDSANGIQVIVATAGNGLMLQAGLSGGDGIAVSAIGGNGRGISATGQGTGAGIIAEGGSDGSGIIARGGASNGHGIQAVAQTFGEGISAEGGVTSGSGIRALGGGGGSSGMTAEASANAPGFIAVGIVGPGISAVGTGGASGISAIGDMDGIHAESNGTGHGINALGGSTAGDGIHAVAQTVGDGIEAVGVGGGFDINADIQGSLSGSVGSVTGNVGGNVVGTVASVVGNVGGNVVGSVGSVAAGGITAASIATDAIDSDAIAASAVTEIQAGLATAAALATVQADTDDIQARLPATLNGGRMRSHVEAMDAGTITAAVIATGAVDADALATDAVTEITVAVDAAVTASHGVGSYVDSGTPPTVGAIADQVWDEVLAGHLTPGSTGFALDAAAAGGAGLTAQQVRDAMKLTPTAGAPAAGSVDEHLDDILADTAAMQPLIDVATSTRATDAGVDAAVTASHGVGSYVDTGAAPSAASVADAVWDEATAGHAIVGSTGEALTQAATGGSAPTVGQIADGVWDELLAGHAIVGSTGEALTDAAAGGAGLTPQQVADALKLAPAAGAPAAGSVYGQLDDIETCACSGGNGDSDVNVEGI